MDFVYAPTVVQISFRLVPVCNIFETLGLMQAVEELSGMNPWIYETVSHLPEDVRITNGLINRAGGWHLVAEADPQLLEREFPEFLAWLESLAPEKMREIMAGWMIDIPGDKTPPTLDEIFSSRDVMMGQVSKMVAHKQSLKDYDYTTDGFDEVFLLMQDPSVLKARVLEHLHWVWENVLREEWEHKLPQLQASVEAYQQLDFQNLTALEAVRTITGRDLSNTGWEWSQTDLVFIPSPHIGPYIGRFDSGDNKRSYVMFGVRQPPQTRGYSPELTRAELTPRLTALADDTRLQILETLAQHDELYAQDIMNMLDLTQSAASRNLRQLVATGYLVERRRETAKCYSINRERVDETMRALRRLLRKKGASA